MFLSLVLFISLFAGVVSAEALPEVAAMFSTTNIELHKQKEPGYHPQTSKWHIWRFKNKVASSNEKAQIGEVWQLLKGGDVSYSWVFHDKKFIINYSPSDLKALEQNPKWITKASIISPELLKKLNKKGKQKVLGYEAEKYIGDVGGYHIEILWLPEYKMPARIKQTTATQMSDVELLEIYPMQKAPWKPKDINDYQDMDFADIGDNEADPLLQFYMQKMSKVGGLGEHAHHH